MKVLLITLLLAASAFGAVVRDVDVLEEGPACPIDDPLTFAEGNINITLLPILEIDLGSTQGGGVAVGLSTLYYKYTINFLTLEITFEARISASVSGAAYAATGVIDASPFSNDVIPSGTFVGAGAYAGAIVNGEAKGTASILVDIITDKVSIWKMSLSQVTFDSISVNLEGFTSAGVLVDWAAWSAGAKENFDKEFAVVGQEFVDRVRTQVLNPLLAPYSLAEFLEIIGSGSTPAPCPTTPANKF